MKVKIPILLIVLLLSSILKHTMAQTATQKQNLEELAAQLKQKSQAEKAEAIRVANEKGWPVRTEDENGRITELMRLDENGMPMYYTTFNAEGAALINSDELYTGGASGLNLSGAGQTLGEWDGGAVLTTHQELSGRVTQEDSPSGTSWHATHVAGTMIASGVVSAAKGMSYGANLSAYDWNNDESEMATEAAGGMKVSQHSYGLITGWASGNWSGNSGWHWWGNPDVSETEDFYWGFYSSQAEDWDEIAYNAPNYLIVKSAGNDRGEGITSGSHYVRNPSNGWAWEASTTARQLDGGSTGYQSVAHSATSKNLMVVGAVHNSTAMSSFSGWGPTDDGRIKPDIVAKGVSVLSSHSAGNDQYSYSNGTSMSGPMVSGSVGLLLEHQENLNPGVPLRSATMKGLILHTATDLGNAGPDYVYGWGLMNTQAAAEVMSANESSPVHIYEASLSDGASYSLDLKATGSEPLKATLIWTDPAGTSPGTPLNPTDLMLVNDLDMRIEDAGAIISYPYILDPANPSNVATTGDNFRDNVEVINIASPVAGAIYTLTINHKGTLSSPQNYSLIITGNEDFDYTYIANGTDVAGNYTQSDFVAEGNKGKGFSNWYNASNNGGYFRASAGEQGANSGTIDSNGNSFGMWADDFSDVGRALFDNLFNGQSVTFSLAYQWDNGNRGFTLNNGGWSSGEQVFFFNINSSGYSWTDGGSAASTAWPGLREFGVAMTFTFTQNGNDIDYSFSSPAGGGPSGSGTISSASFDRIKFYVSGAGGGTGANMYFNNLQVNTTIADVAANSDAIFKGDVTIDANLTLDNLLIESGNSVTIEPTINLTVNATTDNQAGTSALFLQSDATGTASLLHNTADVDMTIQRYLTGDVNTDNAKYHTVSVPLTAGSNPQTGLFMGSYLYRFDFATQNYVSMGTSTTTPMDVDQGYLLYYPDANITYDFAGKANNGSFTAAVDYGVPFNYNLVPNPYPSAIDWDAASGWTKTNMNNAVYVYNTGSSSQGNIVWASYVGGSGTNGGSRYIPAGQAFFVQSNAAAPALSMTNEVRVHNSQAFYKNKTEETETLRLFAHSGDFTDEIVVRYLAESSPDFDGQYDALKFKNWNAAPNIYSLTADKTELSINSIPYSTETYVMELGFECSEAGEASIEVQGMESFGDWVTIFLEDLLTGARIDLRDQNTYSFIHEPENDPLRFTLRFMGVTGTDELSTENDILIWSANSMLYLSHFADAPALMEVFDLQGRLLYSEKLNGMSSTSVGNLPLDQVLIVRLSSNESVTNQKVLIR